MKSKYCKYIFTCYNEYTDEMIDGLRGILNISENTNPDALYSRENIDWSALVIYKKGIGAFVITNYRHNYIDKFAIFVKEESAEDVKQLLLRYREEMCKDYGEDHMKEIKLRSNEEFLYLEELSIQYGFYRDIKEFLE